MRYLLALLFVVILAACSTSRREPPSTPVTPPAPKASAVETPRTSTSTSTSKAATLDAYKQDLALHISQISAVKVHNQRPQALLRSVVVVKYVVDAEGNLVRSEILRSNRDRETETIALASLRNAAPFPKPGKHLLRRGQLELAETWLFNNDGRFQLRTIAQPQMDR
jgi:protein TonB